MIRTGERFAATLDSRVPLANRRVLEIGCGAGHYTKQLAPRCAEIVATDPDPAAVQQAQEHLRLRNVAFQVAPAQDLSSVTGDFHVTIFTLSLHHVPVPLMSQAIDEAVRVTDSDGFIVFLEPDREGSFFEAELAFVAGDGDEREAKSQAYRAMLEHPRLIQVAELADQTEFHWDSLKDFMDTMHPKENLSRVESFLKQNAYALCAKRRINIFKTRNHQ